MAHDRSERERRGEVSPAKVSAKQAKAAFASIPASQIATQRVRRLSCDAIRVLLFAHSVWTPKHAAPMPISRIAKVHGRSKLNVSAAIRSLPPDLLTLRTAAIRPGTMGFSARGAAAVYDVADRRKGTAHRVFEPGDRRYDGTFRIDCPDLRRRITVARRPDADSDGRAAVMKLAGAARNGLRNGATARPAAGRRIPQVRGRRPRGAQTPCSPVGDASWPRPAQPPRLMPAP